jgi:hypothetical protein
VPQPIDSGQTISDDANEEAAMIAGQYIRAVYENATTEFIESAKFEALVSGQASSEFFREFVRNVFRTHYLSSHIVALCYASLPSTAAAVLRENLLEEMGRSEDEPPHSALLRNRQGRNVGTARPRQDRTPPIERNEPHHQSRCVRHRPAMVALA